MEITDIIKDRLSVTLDRLESIRPGITLRAIEESKVELNLTTTLSDLQKLQLGVYASIKLCRSALDLYQEELSTESADDISREYQERIQFLREKLAQLEKEYRQLESIIFTSPDVVPPCYKIVKSE